MRFLASIWHISHAFDVWNHARLYSSHAIFGPINEQPQFKTNTSFTANIFNKQIIATIDIDIYYASLLYSMLYSNERLYLDDLKWE